MEKSGKECVGEEGGGEEDRRRGGEVRGSWKGRESVRRKGESGSIIRYGVIEEIDWLHLSRWYLQDGTSVLMKPSEKGYSIVVEHLLENGANPNLADWVSNIAYRSIIVAIIELQDKSW